MTKCEEKKDTKQLMIFVEYRLNYYESTREHVRQFKGKLRVKLMELVPAILVITPLVSFIEMGVTNGE